MLSFGMSISPFGMFSNRRVASIMSAVWLICQTSSKYNFLAWCLKWFSHELLVHINSPHTESTSSFSHTVALVTVMQYYIYHAVNSKTVICLVNQLFTVTVIQPKVAVNTYSYLRGRYFESRKAGITMGFSSTCSVHGLFSATSFPVYRSQLLFQFKLSTLHNLSRWQSIDKQKSSKQNSWILFSYCIDFQSYKAVTVILLLWRTSHVR
jgi:hypothetical protein